MNYYLLGTLFISTYLEKFDSPPGRHRATSSCQAQVDAGGAGHHTHIQVAPGPDTGPLVDDNRETIPFVKRTLQLLLRLTFNFFNDALYSNRHPVAGFCVLEPQATKSHR